MTGPPGRSTGNAAPAHRPHVALARGGAIAAGPLITRITGRGNPAHRHFRRGPPTHARITNKPVNPGVFAPRDLREWTLRGGAAPPVGGMGGVGAVRYVINRLISSDLTRPLYTLSNCGMVAFRPAAATTFPLPDPELGTNSLALGMN